MSIDTHAPQNSVLRLIEVENHFNLGNSIVPVLKGITFSVQAGEFVSIVGPSGSGKSTLLNMITGIDAPTAGDVLVTGRSIHGMSENELAAWRGENVGIIFQFFQMLPALNLLQNVILPMEFAKQYPRRERRDQRAVGPHARAPGRQRGRVRARGARGERDRGERGAQGHGAPDDGRGGGRPGQAVRGRARRGGAARGHGLAVAPPELSAQRGFFRLYS